MIFDQVEHEFDAFRNHIPHRHHDQATAGTENHPMPVLSDVKNIIAALDANPLIGAIAERNLGTLLNPAEVTAVANFVRDLENAKRPQVAAAQHQPQTPTAPSGTAVAAPVQRPIA